MYYLMFISINTSARTHTQAYNTCTSLFAYCKTTNKLGGIIDSKLKLIYCAHRPNRNWRCSYTNVCKRFGLAAVSCARVCVWKCTQIYLQKRKYKLNVESQRICQLAFRSIVCFSVCCFNFFAEPLITRFNYSHTNELGNSGATVSDHGRNWNCIKL